ncbi:LysR family transcriptional regulator [Maritalea mediterranea]|uniref:LysR family transcriptional regulator n=1 Tax=Maritalea mediterranea TaxID=2909667 RepID=A0ABS9E2F9_9HYPH|nr:LysR family transcriptional regulator [Maritalea mediterranea]MCF4097040.1 LysR family transcriptional regulator [Maritalea mediterranea]
MDMIDGMRTFVAVVEAGTITAAADRLNISKKLASKYLAALEAQIGVKLLNRTTRSQSLTVAGQQYYLDCQDIIARIDESHSALKRAEGELIGHLRLSAPVSFGEVVLLPLLAKFKRKHPELSFDVRLSDSYVDLIEGGFDFALRIGALSDSSLVARKLTETHLWLVASSAYLRRHTAPETPEDLRHHLCLQDSNYRGGARWPFQIDGVTRHIAIQPQFVTNSATAMRNLALMGEGIALVPDFVVKSDIEAGKLVQLLPDFPSLTLPIQAVLPLNRNRPARVRAAIDFLARTLD